MVGGRYLLQLRDDKPGISAPGVWALFGGQVEPSETAERAVRREVEEELGLRLGRVEFLWEVDAFNEFHAAICRYSLFQADVTDHWGRHRLTEGRDAAVFAFEQLPRLAMPELIHQQLKRHFCRMELKPSSFPLTSPLRCRTCGQPFP